ncbi:metallophosphoesterase family protein [Cyclobacterium amurskyense]|uniref:Calcineurin-like phosphoesterase domain-containing protein n=1 Tax=Cyclobacterium amurskyense TaxID=320787 RepID=A0A0H4PIH4_9BACT|nr:metallophosphoesterase [Cyclobacterium amurskyense]AKP52855.1 hypothetical protein CA2015_3468 [Cyclobacterium amurskyense]
MKRRAFISKLSTSSSLVFMGKGLSGVHINPIPPFAYPEANLFSEVLNKAGEFMLRLEFLAFGTKLPQKVTLNFYKNKALLYKIKDYPFANHRAKVGDEGRQFQFQVGAAFPYIFAIWIKNPQPDTMMNFTLNGKDFHLSLGELVDKKELSIKVDKLQVSSNYLLDLEIGQLDPAILGISPEGKNFDIAILADPQGGDPKVPKAHPTRVKIHNAFAEDTIKRVNELPNKPVLTLVLGDLVDNQGEMAHFAAMRAYLKALESPILLAIGNHETRYQSTFTPGYKMDEFNHYFSAQKAMNGMEWLLYSFDLGDWHFIVWPDPLRENFFETHPHYFEWLATDLEKNKDKPTVFFQHVPSHPIGIDPLINYAESIAVKRMLLNLLTKRGNVRFVFSGHVHIPIIASQKTAVTYKGIKMINIPAAGYRPRAFGEEEIHGGPSQGLLVFSARGKVGKAFFKTVTEEIYTYPEEIPEFSKSKFPLWLNYKWELPSEKDFQNGDFSAGLDKWHRRYVYKENQTPSNLMEVREFGTYKALYLFSAKRAYSVPGQDRLPQTINHLCQAISLGKEPKAIGLEYCLDKESVKQIEAWAGGYVWLEGFIGSTKLLNMAYWLGKGTPLLKDRFSDHKAIPFLHFELDSKEETWKKAQLNWQKDYENQGVDVSKLDRLVINLGTWHINDGNSAGFGLYFTNIGLMDASGVSIVGEKPIKEMPIDKLWWLNKNMPFSHIAGEHRYIMSTKTKI